MSAIVVQLSENFHIFYRGQRENTFIIKYVALALQTIDANVTKLYIFFLLNNIYTQETM